MQTFAQKNFYFRPKIENKVHNSLSERPQTNSFFNNNYSVTYNSIPYGEVKSAVFSTSKSITFGVNVGVNFKNDDLLEVGWTQDQSGTKIKLSTFGSAAAFPNDYGVNNTTSTTFNTINHRFELLYFKKIKTNRESTLLNIQNSYFVFGTGMKYVPYTVNNGINPLSGFSLAGQAANYDDISMYWNHEVYAIKKLSTFLTFGLSSDLNYNNKYLFSCAANYTVGFNVLQATRDKLTVYENGTLLKTYHYETYSRGSGFQLQISRKFQFYPWKSKN
ncbi:hypothetical protein DNU06_06150 [Putridiphycobacter roseus]|uniref:Outer membrane protein beta-barrel domain-containing protein n=1 Tax=Putridiphycobacter roseus TaxID=2219161 RepID=A0A2W1NGG5_9FLAO|nr:hypothetical protein DNU06_06150 [Putridiphycobacter roseus]